MTFANAPAYGPGTHVRCDNCRDPEALMEARSGSAVVFRSILGTDEATEAAIARHGFVRVPDGRLLCGGCAVAEGT